MNVPTPSGGGSDKPVCPDHNNEMIYDPNAGNWTCPDFRCKKTARQRISIGDVSGVVLVGDYHLYSQGTGADERFFIYIRQLNAFLDITPRVSVDTTGDVHGKTKEFHLGLEFPELNRSPE